MSTLDQKTREELSLLLPWYANGTLDDAENALVEEALKSDELLAAEYELILEDQAAVIDLVSSEEVPASMEERFKVALNAAATAGESAPIEQASSSESFVEKMISLFFPTRTVAIMAVAAALVLCVQAGIIFSMVDGNQPGNQYQTASGEEEAADIKLRFLVKFKADAEFGLIEKLLKELDGQIIKGPTADGFYELGFKDESQQEHVAKTLEANSELFQFILPAN